MTDKDIFDISTKGIDSRALSNLIIELNISRRNSRSYPKGHQIIDASLQKVLNTYENLMSTEEEIVIGVACDALLVGNTPLEKSNQIYRDFARVLYERGIGALVLHRGLNSDELVGFISILSAKREEIHEDGGIEGVWRKTGISSIEIRVIRYDLFATTEEAFVSRDEARACPEGLWERFVRGLVNGVLTPDGVAESSLDPELLAEVLNRQFNPRESDDLNYAQDITEFMRQSDIYQGSETHHSDLAYRKLATFVGKLTPGLRRQFLNSTFDIRKIKSDTAEGIIRQFSTDVVIETLDDINQQQINVPPFVLGLLQQMSKHASPGQQQASIDMPDQELHEKMRTIFKEHAMEEFIPDSYQLKLNKMLSAEQIPMLGLEGVQDLMDTFDASKMESRTSEILLLLLASGYPTEEGYSTLAENLHDMCAFFLQTGDYGQLLKILRRLGEDQIPAETRRDLLGLFVRPEFLEEIINGLQIWGKVKYNEIGELIGEIGEPFVEILLDRLVNAESMSLRRFMMDRLADLGPVAGPAIIGRLSDERWYFLRNLIVMIRKLDLVSSVEKLRPLASHHDQRVRQEALKALLQFHDAGAESRIILDLESHDREIRMNAIRIAEKCASPPILDKMHALLTGPGLSNKEYELKNSVVQALAEIGNTASLPVLERALAARNIFHPLLLKRLKLDIVESLGRYPAQASRPILERIAQGSDNLAQQAAHLLLSLPGRQS